MSKLPKPDDYAYAADHGPAIIQARNNFISELQARIIGASGRDARAFIDYMIETRYLSPGFFAAWSFMGDDNE